MEILKARICSVFVRFGNVYKNRLRYDSFP